mgnify:CR=1 FL=1|tara:strand:+ start:210 stop:419 length:210 start_codon:yes stop_codon:yes gene_type:complete
MGLITDQQLEKENLEAEKRAIKFNLNDLDFLLKLITDSMIKGSQLQQAVTTVIKLQKLKSELEKTQIKP